VIADEILNASAKIFGYFDDHSFGLVESDELGWVSRIDIVL